MTGDTNLPTTDEDKTDNVERARCVWRWCCSVYEKGSRVRSRQGRTESDGVDTEGGKDRSGPNPEC